MLKLLIKCLSATRLLVKNVVTKVYPYFYTINVIQNVLRRNKKEADSTTND